VYTVYKVTNLINGNYYIGVHKTNDPNDSYMGSGKRIRRAIEKYGLTNFSKEILFIFENEEDAYLKEKELLSDIWNLQECYNCTEGGLGSWSHIDSSGDNNCMKRPEVKENVRSSLYRNGTYYSEKRVAAARENSKKGVIARTGSKDSKETKEKRAKSVKKAYESADVKQRHKDAVRKGKCIPYLLTEPNGIEYHVDVISEFCEKNNYPLSTITTKSNGEMIKRGKLKGWTVYKNLKKDESS
jgi:hypothetical protein